jgi:homoserine acetyltransferase
MFPEAKVVYETYGRLNAAHDNVVLLPSHYMANHHGYEWLIGPGLALDTAKLFLVSTELFGNGFSPSPSNTPEPYHGPRFPVTTIRDNVDAVHRLLVDELKVQHLRAVIGFSMGGQQGPALVHAVGDRSVFPVRRRAVRGAIHSRREAGADSVVVWASGGGGGESGG